MEPLKPFFFTKRRLAARTRAPKTQFRGVGVRPGRLILGPLEPARSNWFVVRNEVLATCIVTVILADTISDN